jgi:ClpP class serine protease
MTDGQQLELKPRRRKPAERVLALVAQEQWAILPESLQLLVAIAAREHTPSFEAVLAKQAERMNQESRSMVRGNTAIISVYGPIFRRANLFTEMSGASSIEMLALDFQEAIDSPNITSIILDMDTPGGMVSGTSEFADQIRASRKPVIAYVGNLAASAGYWIASAARTIVMNKTAQVGSIGVVSSMYVDDDDTLVEIVSTQSPNKRPDVRSEEGRSQVQRNTDELAQIFIDTVASNRKVTSEKVAADFGKGGLLIGASAVNAGMADRIGSLESLLEQLNRK